MVGPIHGPLSSGDVGEGRMAEPEAILQEAARVVARSHDLYGKRVVVTAGGTQEPIDPVRFVGNRSSGRMGAAMAQEAAGRGAKVTVVIGPTQLPPPAGVDLVRVKTADEMHDAVLATAPDADAMVMAAAVADFKPDRASPAKLKKAEGPPEITLVPTTDILAELGGPSGARYRKPSGILVGFAAETESDPERLTELARQKRAAKGADVVVANDVASADSGFEVPTNRAVIADRAGVTDLGLVTKTALARALDDRISALLSQP